MQCVCVERNLAAHARSQCFFHTNIPSSMTSADYVLLRAFDVVSSGQYRKFVLRQKELCEDWALAMHENYQRTMQQIRRVAKEHSTLRALGHGALAAVCQKIGLCVEVPKKVGVGSFHRCYLTGVMCTEGVRVNPLSEGSPMVVHQKFLKFCASLWFILRFENVLRQVMRTQYPREHCESAKLDDILTEIHASRARLLDPLISMLDASLRHVQVSLEKPLARPADVLNRTD